MFCPNCGYEISTSTEICPNCSANVQTMKNSTQPHQSVRPQQMAAADKPNIAVNLISLCCFPILGIIMYFVWKDSQPAAAKSALIFGLVGFGVVFVLNVLFFGLGILGSMVGA